MEDPFQSRDRLHYLILTSSGKLLSELGRSDEGGGERRQPPPFLINQGTLSLMEAMGGVGNDVKEWTSGEKDRRPEGEPAAEEQGSCHGCVWPTPSKKSELQVLFMMSQGLLLGIVSGGSTLENRNCDAAR